MLVVYYIMRNFTNGNLMLISVETDSMNNFINRVFFQIVVRFNVSFFFFVNSMGKNREGVMVMKIISKLCFESINFTIVSFVIFKNALCIKITIPFHNEVGMV